MNKKLKKRLKIIFILIIIISCFIIFFDLYISISSKKNIFNDVNKINNFEYCLLLGTSKYTYGKKINLFYQYRIDAVKLLYDNNKINKIILSGDSRKSSYDEPKYMKNDLLKLGISDNVLLIDSDGFRTIYSIISLIKKYKIKDALIVSQRFHLERAIFIGKFFGLKLIGFAAKPVYGYSGFKIQVRERGARIRLLLDILSYFLNK